MISDYFTINYWTSPVGSEKGHRAITARKTAEEGSLLNFEKILGEEYAHRVRNFGEKGGSYRDRERGKIKFSHFSYVSHFELPKICGSISTLSVAQ